MSELKCFDVAVNFVLDVCHASGLSLEVSAAIATELYHMGYQKQVEGEWIGIEYDGYADGYPVYDVFECSVCGNEWRGDEPPNFCPDCGTKMKGGN